MEAVDQLYLQCNALQAAHNLAALAAGATLGELGSLEEVVQQLLHRQLLQSIVLKVRAGFKAEILGFWGNTLRSNPPSPRRGNAPLSTKGTADMLHLTLSSQTMGYS